MNEDNQNNNPEPQMPVNEAPAATPPVPVEDVRQPLKSPPQQDKVEASTEAVKPVAPAKVTKPKKPVSTTSTTIVATVIILVVIASMAIYAYLKK